MLSAKELAVSGVFGAIAIVVAAVLGTGVLIATGIPITGGLVSIFATLLIVVIGIKIIDKFGAATVMFAVIGILSIPTLVGGPPGVHKIGIMLPLGLALDIVIFIFKRRDLGYMLGGAIACVLAAVLAYIALAMLGLPQAETLRPLLLYFSIIYAILGFVGAYAGILVYDRKIEHLSVVQNLKS